MITIDISKYDWNLAQYHARKAELGGVSQVRTGVERAAALPQDQTVGQLGTLALVKYLYGTTERYLFARSAQNRTPHDGDGGQDIIGANLDVKTSVMRYGQDPTKYNLCVRPRERHAEWVYVLALVPKDYEDNRVVHLVGWCSDEQLPLTPAADGPLAGAYVVPAGALVPLPPIRYDWLA